MRRIFQLTAAVAVILWSGCCLAAVGPRPAAERIRFEMHILPPMAYTRFCLQYSSECLPKKAFRGGPVRITDDKMAELVRVNDEINGSIFPERNVRGLAGEVWLIGPRRGDCNDYAVTKRHELMMLGWPARVLLLSEVVATSGEHHLVLVVRTSDGDLVLDNLTSSVKLWSRTPYRWVRMQNPGIDGLWTTIANRGS